MVQCRPPSGVKRRRNHRHRMNAPRRRRIVPIRRVGREAHAVPSLLLLLLAFLVSMSSMSTNRHPHNNITRGVDASPLSDILSSAAERLLSLGDDLDDDDDDENNDVNDDGAATLDIVQISSMRVRDIRRRLSRYHGYDSKELHRMIDKKDLINALSFEEHKMRRRQLDRRRWRRYRTMAIYTCFAILVVIFWPLMRHVVEVGHVNFVVYVGECYMLPPPRAPMNAIFRNGA